jgi:hypothetical protein
MKFIHSEQDYMMSQYEIMTQMLKMHVIPITQLKLKSFIIVTTESVAFQVWQYNYVQK